MNFFKNIFLVGGLISLFILAGCKQISFPNGEVPSNYLELIKKYTADYKGAIGSNQGVLQISFDGKKFHAKFSGKINDITGNIGCQSVIGDLQSIQINDSGTELEAASFAFSPNYCPEIRGRSLDLIFTQKASKLEMSAMILNEVKEVQICQDTPPPSPTHSCRIDFQNLYFTGAFEKP